MLLDANDRVFLRAGHVSVGHDASLARRQLQRKARASERLLPFHLFEHNGKGEREGKEEISGGERGGREKVVSKKTVKRKSAIPLLVYLLRMMIIGGRGTKH